MAKYNIKNRYLLANIYIFTDYYNSGPIYKYLPRNTISIVLIRLLQQNSRLLPRNNNILPLYSRNSIGSGKFINNIVEIIRNTNTTTTIPRQSNIYLQISPLLPIYYYNIVNLPIQILKNSRIGSGKDIGSINSGYSGNIGSRIVAIGVIVANSGQQWQWQSQWQWKQWPNMVVFKDYHEGAISKIRLPVTGIYKAADYQGVTKTAGFGEIWGPIFWPYEFFINFLKILVEKNLKIRLEFYNI